MTAQLIDGVALSARLRADVATRVQALQAQGITPGLAVILVGDDPASAVYVRNKIKACADTGVRSVFEKYEATLTRRRASGAHRRAQRRPDDPRHPGADATCQTHQPAQGDRGHRHQQGRRWLRHPERRRAHDRAAGFRPCTPYGCMKLIETTGIDLRGKHAVVIGRSNTVGKPMALLLLQANATVTICHSATADMGHHTRQADVIVAAVGKRNVLTADMVKPGAVVIDVGMNRNDEGKLCGDVDFAGVREVASHITPVPGGVGPMTITMLLVNTLEAAERAAAGPRP
jgi:methylenetetrahydrofolate dehydrogenase (NADP+)/methenyltetrahydrofolate cyclohydrolase